MGCDLSHVRANVTKVDACVEGLKSKVENFQKVLVIKDFFLPTGKTQHTTLFRWA